MRRLMAGAVLAVGLTGGGAVAVSSGTAVAQEDYCTLSPDVGYVPVYYDFTSSCAAHDWCYEVKPYGDTSAGRKQCDDDFRANMKGWCNGYYRTWWQAPARVACRGTADAYYNAVRTFGGAFF